MPRPTPQILPPSMAASLHANSPNHPLLRQQYAAEQVLPHIHSHFSFSPSHLLCPNQIPQSIRLLADHYNKHYLNKPNDLRISVIGLWHIVHHRYSSKNPPPSQPFNHEVIYLFDRYPRIKESDYTHRSFTFVKPAITSNVQADKIRSVTTIDIPADSNGIDFALDLH